MNNKFRDRLEVIAYVDGIIDASLMASRLEGKQRLSEQELIKWSDIRNMLVLSEAVKEFRHERN